MPINTNPNEVKDDRDYSPDFSPKQNDQSPSNKDSLSAMNTETQDTSSSSSTSFYRTRPSHGRSLGKRALGVMIKNRRRLTIGGIISTVIIAPLVTLILGILPAFQLINFRENVADFFDSRHDYSMSQRAFRSHYRVLLGPDGQFDGFRERGLVGKLVNVNTDKIVSDLRAQGFEVEFDQNTRAVTRIITPTGATENLGSLSNQRSEVRSAIKRLYPEMGTLRRGIKARQLYTRFGIRRQFFDIFRSSSDGDLSTRDRFRKGMRRYLYGANAHSLNTMLADADSNLEDEEARRQDTERRTRLGNVNDRVLREADALRADAIENPSKAVRVNILRDTGEITRRAATIAARNSVISGAAAFLGSGIALTADAICEVKVMVHSIEEGARTLRAEDLAQFSGTLMTAADSVKQGESVDPIMLNETMNYLQPRPGEEDMTAAAGYQYVTGSTNPQLDANSQDKYSLDGGNIGLMDTFNRYTGASPGLQACRVITNPAFQIGAAALSLVVTIGTVGTFEAIDTATAVGRGLVIGFGVAMVEPLLTQQIAGMTITMDETPVEIANAAVAGYSVISNTNGAAMGGQQLSDSQLAQINTQIAEARAHYNSQQSLAYRLFSPKNPSSLLTRVAMATPTSLGGVVTKFSSLFNLGNLISSITNPTEVIAQSNNPAVDIFGVPQYGFTDEMLNEFDLLENHRWIIDDYTGECADGNGGQCQELYERYVADCLDSRRAYVFADLVDEKCNDNAEMYRRFRIYHFDEIIADGLVEYTTGNFSSGTASPNQAGRIGSIEGSTQELAQQILDIVDGGGNISFGSTASSSAREVREPFEQLARGNLVPVPVRNSETRADPDLLRAILALSKENIPLRITSYTTGTHSSTSLHYTGKAVDFGNEENAVEIMNFLYENRRELNIDELIYVNPPRGTSNLSNGQPHNYSQGTLNAHRSHIHLGVK